MIQTPEKVTLHMVFHGMPRLARRRLMPLQTMNPPNKINGPPTSSARGRLPRALTIRRGSRIARNSGVMRT